LFLKGPLLTIRVFEVVHANLKEHPRIRARDKGGLNNRLYSYTACGADVEAFTEAEKAQKAF